MTPHELRQRTKTFALTIIKFCRLLPKTDEARIIRWQLLRCGPAVGANYRAVCRCRSDKDFIAKLGIVIEEADETAFWLELLVEAAIVTAAAAKSIWREAGAAKRPNQKLTQITSDEVPFADHKSQIAHIIANHKSQI